MSLGPLLAVEGRACQAFCRQHFLRGPGSPQAPGQVTSKVHHDSNELHKRYSVFIAIFENIVSAIHEPCKMLSDGRSWASNCSLPLLAMIQLRIIASSEPQFESMQTYHYKLGIVAIF